MSAHVTEHLPDWLNEGLDAPLLAEVQAHVDTCGPCAEAAAELIELQALVILALTPLAPNPAVRAGLLQGTSSGRLHRFAGHISQLFGVPEDQARLALDAVDGAAGWEVSAMPGVTQLLWPGAPPNHLMGFIRVPRGGTVPWHEHLGQERTLVLQGRMVDNDGVVYLPGEEMPKVQGTRHTFGAHGPLDLVCGVLIENGFSLID